MQVLQSIHIPTLSDLTKFAQIFTYRSLINMIHIMHFQQDNQTNVKLHRIKPVLKHPH